MTTAVQYVIWAVDADSVPGFDPERFRDACQESADRLAVLETFHWSDYDGTYTRPEIRVVPATPNRPAGLYYDTGAGQTAMHGEDHPGVDEVKRLTEDAWTAAHEANPIARVPSVTVERLTWTTPPELQGQFSRVAYAADERCIWRRTRTAAGTVYHERAPLAALEDDEFAPWARKPTVRPDAWVDVEVYDDGGGE